MQKEEEKAEKEGGRGEKARELEWSGVEWSLQRAGTGTGIHCVG
jgi:hypothetical protein